MKKSIISMIFMLVLVLSIGSVSAFGMETVYGKLRNDGSKVYISLSCDKDIPLGVIRFYVDFDTETASFRSAKVVNSSKNIIMDYNEENGRITIVFLNSRGFNMSNNYKDIICLTFTKASHGLFTLSADGAYDIDTNKMDFSASNRLNISKNGESKSVNATTNKSTTQDKSNNNSVLDEPMLDSPDEIVNADSEVTHIIIDDSKELFDMRSIIIGIAIALIAVWVIFTAYRFGMTKAKKDSEEKTEHEEKKDTLEDDI